MDLLRLKQTTNVMHLPDIFIPEILLRTQLIIALNSGPHSIANSHDTRNADFVPNSAQTAKSRPPPPPRRLANARAKGCPRPRRVAHPRRLRGIPLTSSQGRGQGGHTLRRNAKFVATLRRFMQPANVRIWDCCDAAGLATGRFHPSTTHKHNPPTISYTLAKRTHREARFGTFKAH
ncbi:hypothetical protein CKAH01_07647 [Colletotrichum kahawae]|uniref:Uncharacterized protein n=1 Tax=Colletotrichum kahawae TaxID=34407 RepID=A0AAD9Y5E8_COLKA|nr:hypothetical protein CKAH01_07647 [Colletotrichum kahawae]